MIPREAWEWYGQHGHFVMGKYCRYHLNTKVGPWIVSTVGEYVPPPHCGLNDNDFIEWWDKNKPGVQIWSSYYYETMVFEAGPPCTCGCGITVPSSWMDIDCVGSMTAAEAHENHMAMCEKWSMKEEGATNEVPQTTDCD